MKPEKESQAGLVTVIVASYNHAEYLDQRIKSLLSQTYKGIEILVIDDKSPDNSVEILTKYKNVPNYRLILREKNGGWVEVSNQGAALAHGEFIIFANCDDYCEPRLIEKLVAGIQSKPSIGIAFSCSKIVDSNGIFLSTDFEQRELSFKKKCGSDTFLTGSEMSKFLIHSCVIPNLSAALIRKDSFFSAGGLSEDFKVCCDWDLFFRIANTNDFYYISEALNDFRQHRTTIRSMVKNRIIVEEYFKLLYPNLEKMDLKLLERLKFKIRIGKIWADNILTPSFSGVKNIAYHFAVSFKYNKMCGFYLLIGLVLRALEIIFRLPKYLSRIFIANKAKS